jgi:hypothetical protein
MESRASSRLTGVMTKSDVQQYHPQRLTKPCSISMSPNQLDLLPPDQAAILIRKKRFWKRTMWISLAASVFTGSAGWVYYETSMSRIWISNGNADIALHIIEAINVLAIVTYLFMPLTALCFLIYLVSLIRVLSLPKIPKPSDSKSMPNHHP